jgi:hypothetical protein
MIIAALIAHKRLHRSPLALSLSLGDCVSLFAIVKENKICKSNQIHQQFVIVVRSLTSLRLSSRARG